MAKHIEAMGGLDNWDRIESIRLSGTVERDGKTVDIVIVKKRPNQIRATVTVPVSGQRSGHMQLIRAHDGTSAWTATRLAGAQETIKTAMTGDDAASLLADAGVAPRLIQLWEANEPLKLVGRSQFGGREAFILELSKNGVDVTHRFILDAKSHRTFARETFSAKGSTLTRLSAYEAHAGVYVPTYSEMITQGTSRSIIRIESIETGVGIYPDYFSRLP